MSYRVPEWEWTRQELAMARTHKYTPPVGFSFELYRLVEQYESIKGRSKMRRSRSSVRIDYDAIFRLSNGDWVEIDAVPHLTREQFVKDLRSAAKNRGLEFDAMWAKKGWIMIRAAQPVGTAKPESKKEDEL